MWFDIVNVGLEENHIICPHYKVYEHKYTLGEWYHSICSIGYCKDVNHWFVNYVYDFDLKCSEPIEIEELEYLINIEEFIDYLEGWINERLIKFYEILGRPL